MENYSDLNEGMYKNFYKNSANSKLLVKIWSDALGDNYPKGLQNFGFVTNEDLDTAALYLKSNLGSSLLDIGCGQGGPGLQLAERNDLELTGIDIIAAAIEQANKFKENFNLSRQANFVVGGFLNIPLPDNSIDNILSIDAFWMVQEKVEALKEIKRVIKKGGKFIFTTWDNTLSDSSYLFEKCGFDIISRNETRNWKEYQLAVYNSILENQKDLLNEIGESAQILISEAKTVPPLLEVNTRYLYYTRAN